MSGRVAIVTDSTAYLPTALGTSLGVRTVPLQVVIDGTAYDEADIDLEDFVEVLRADVPVTTSRPNPEAFAAVYADAAADGASAVVSVHLSAEMSGTVDSARLAGRSAAIPVHVVDSRAIAMSLGFGVLAGARTAAEGADGDEVEAAAAGRCARTRTFFYVDTLEYLRRGGRIGPAAARLGTALAVKPLLHIEDGTIAPLEKVRTASRAIARLEELAAEAAGTDDVDLAVQHLANGSRAEEIAGRLGDRIPNVHEVVLEEVGAVVGCHVGPGLLAVAVSKR